MALGRRSGFEICFQVPCQANTVSPRVMAVHQKSHAQIRCVALHGVTMSHKKALAQGQSLLVSGLRIRLTEFLSHPLLRASLFSASSANGFLFRFATQFALGDKPSPPPCLAQDAALRNGLTETPEQAVLGLARFQINGQDCFSSFPKSPWSASGCGDCQVGPDYT